MIQEKINNKIFKVASLGSGSKGNATLVSAGDVHLLIDCGFTVKEISKRFDLLGFQPENLSAILVTHEHQDHIKGAGALSRKYKLPVYATHGTCLSGKLGDCQQKYISLFEHFSFEGVRIEAFSIPHDAREPCQFVIDYAGKRLGVISDLGSVTKPIIEKLQSCHALLLEMNHDYDLLMKGVYPLSLKRRVGGNLGHLNNQQSIELLKKMDLDKLEFVVATHLSEQNNCPKLVEDLLKQALENTKVQYKIADQQSGLGWVNLI